jgi:cytochrome c551/c552
MDVAKKYKGQTTYKYSSYGSDNADAKEFPLVEGLIKKVSKGGSGNWGSQPMPANNPVGNKTDKIKHLVEFILGLAK